MDTRAVIRSRRHSARLQKQLRDGNSVNQSMPNRLASDKKVSRTRSAAPKPATTEPTTSKPATSKSATTKKVRFMTEAAPNRAPQPTVTADSALKKGECVADLPYVPNFSLAKATHFNADNMHQAPDMALSRKPSAEATGDIESEGQGGHTRAIKTAQSAMRLVDETPQDVSRGAKNQAEETANRESSSLPEKLRRSARLAGSTPEFEDTKMPVNDTEPKTTQPFTTERNDVASLTSSKGGPAIESNDPLGRDSSENSSDSSFMDLEDLPPHNNRSFADGSYEEAYFAENTSPIPELVADIARIVETSSPTAARVSSNNTPNIATSTEASAVNKRATTARALAFESARVTSSINESVEKVIDGAVDEIEYNSSKQLKVADPMLLNSNSGETHPGGETFRIFDNMASLPPAATPSTLTEIQDQRVGPRGIKRPVEEISHEEQDPMPHQTLATSDRPFGTPTRTGNSIESAISRGWHDVADGELGSPGVGLCLDGETVSAGRASESHEQLHLDNTIKCGDCGKPRKKFILCARCLKTGFCGKYCQMWNWPIHREVCDASKEADPDEVKRQEEYLEEAWAGALQMLRENAGGQNHVTGEDNGEQADPQAMADSSFNGHGAGENNAEQGIGPLGGSGGVTGEDGAGQECLDMDADEGMEESLLTDQHVDDDIQDMEDAVFKEPPPTPESMFRTRAMALRLAQAGEI